MPEKAGRLTAPDESHSLAATLPVPGAGQPLHSRAQAAHPLQRGPCLTGRGGTEAQRAVERLQPWPAIQARCARAHCNAVGLCFACRCSVPGCALQVREVRTVSLGSGVGEGGRLPAGDLSGAKGGRVAVQRPGATTVLDRAPGCEGTAQRASGPHWGRRPSAQMPKTAPAAARRPQLETSPS